MNFIKCKKEEITNKNGVVIHNYPVNLSLCYSVYPRDEKDYFLIDFEFQCVAKPVFWTFLNEQERNAVYSTIICGFSTRSGG